MGAHPHSRQAKASRRDAYRNLRAKGKESGNRVVAASSPRMTAEDSPDRKQEAFYRPVFLQCLLSIFGAGGDVSARSRGKWGNTIFVKINRQQEQGGKKALYHGLSRSIFMAFVMAFSISEAGCIPLSIYKKAMSMALFVSAKASISSYLRIR